MEESRKLSGKDLITIGIFSAIYFMLNLAAMFTGFVPVLWLLLPGVTGIVTGIPFLLMTSKVRKPGAVLIMGTITTIPGAASSTAKTKLSDRADCLFIC